MVAPRLYGSRACRYRSTRRTELLDKIEVAIFFKNIKWVKSRLELAKKATTATSKVMIFAARPIDSLHRRRFAARQHSATASILLAQGLACLPFLIPLL